MESPDGEKDEEIEMKFRKIVWLLGRISEMFLDNKLRCRRVMIYPQLHYSKGPKVGSSNR